MSYTIKTVDWSGRLVCAENFDDETKWQLAVKKLMKSRIPLKFYTVDPAGRMTVYTAEGHACQPVARRRNSIQRRRVYA